MRTGICSTDFETRPADRLFADIAEKGYECTQFSFSSVTECGFQPSGQIEIPAAVSDAAVDAIITASEKYNIPIAAVNGTFNMAHPDKEIRDRGIALFDNFASASRKLGSRFITLCSGTREKSNLWSYSPLNKNPDAWEDMADTVKRAVDIAEKYDMTLAIESEASNIIDTPEAARRIMDEVGSDKLKMILDCANLFHRGKAHPENVHDVMEHAFELFGNDIVIAHGKDIKEGDSIDFCGTGEGIVDFVYMAEMLDKWNFKGDMFLHGIYDESKMKSALKCWKDAEKAALR